MEKIRLYISPHDLAQAERFRLRSPLIFALERWSGTLWRLLDNGCLQEAMHPFRVCHLSPGLLCKVEELQQKEHLYPYIVELELQPTQEQDNYSLAQYPSIASTDVENLQIDSAH